MKLTQENIRFIDTYLDNSDVVYADIRIEMTDHVASEIEAIMVAGDKRDFYFIFKDYMVENKSKLLRNNRQFLKTADKKIAKALLNDMLTFRSILLFATALFLLFIARDFLDFKAFTNLLFVVPFVFLIIFGAVYWLALRRFEMDRFSVVERICFPFIVIFHLFTFLNNTSRSVLDIQNSVYLIILISLIISLTGSLFSITLKLAKDYHRKFKSFKMS